MKRPLISFDWAIKRLLRQKANFSILEGFLSELLHQEIIIINIPESEANKHEENDKINKVDILCESQNKELILIELQYNSENDYFHRMLYGTSKLICDNMYEGFLYRDVKKIISINIVYFDLGLGDDYVYYGITNFHGIHIGDQLQLSSNQKKIYSKKLPADIFPEYYIIKVNKFNDIAKDSLDEWIYYLKNNALPEKYAAKGLDKVFQILKYDNMDNNSKLLYDAHQKELAITYGVIETAKYEGKMEGKIEGKIEGKMEGKMEGIIEGKMEGIIENIELTVCNAFKNNLDLSLISKITSLTEQEVISILQKNNLM